MLYTDFIAQWNGKYIDFDNVYGPQCFDLFHQYCVEVLGITDGRVLAAPAAKDIYLNFDNLFGHEMFEKIANTPDGVPQEGDIVLWGSGTYGHVAIFIEGDTNSFRSLDQNYPTGSPVHVQNHTYSGVLGWLRKKGVDSQQQELDKCRVDRDGHWNDLMAIKDKLKIPGEYSLTVIQAELDKLITYEDKVREYEKKIADVQSQAHALDQAVQEKNAELVAVKEKLTEMQKTVDATILDNQGLQKAVQELKQASTLATASGWTLIFAGIRKFFERR